VPAAFPFHYAAARLLLERTADGKVTKKEKHTTKSVEFAIRDLLVFTSPRCRYQKQLPFSLSCPVHVFLSFFLLRSLLVLLVLVLSRNCCFQGRLKRLKMVFSKNFGILLLLLLSL
jgi:hypothetical protein